MSIERTSTTTSFDATCQRIGRLLALGFCIAMVGEGFAQDKGTLTDEFARMSPKERARVAKQEQNDAVNDPAYQQAMLSAEEHFRSGHYEDALAGYETARSLRPLNVYPKVKIEDIRDMIRKRDIEQAAKAAAADTASPEPVKEPMITKVESLPPPPAPVETQVTKPIVTEQPVVEPTVSKPVSPTPEQAKPRPVVVKPPAQEIAPPREVDPVPEPVQNLPDGITENRYLQGNAEVTELFVTAQGRTTVFKRVVHKWGQVYFFEDGLAIDGRVWRERFGERP